MNGSLFLTFLQVSSFSISFTLMMDPRKVLFTLTEMITLNIAINTLLESSNLYARLYIIRYLDASRSGIAWDSSRNSLNSHSTRGLVTSFCTVNRFTHGTLHASILQYKNWAIHRFKRTFHYRIYYIAICKQIMSTHRIAKTM